jgi:hypothetical protein
VFLQNHKGNTFHILSAFWIWLQGCSDLGNLRIVGDNSIGIRVIPLKYPLELLDSHNLWVCNRDSIQMGH